MRPIFHALRLDSFGLFGVKENEERPYLRSSIQFGNKGRVPGKEFPSFKKLGISAPRLGVFVLMDNTVHPFSFILPYRSYQQRYFIAFRTATWVSRWIRREQQPKNLRSQQQHGNFLLPRPKTTKRKAPDELNDHHLYGKGSTPRSGKRNEMTRL